MGVPRRGCPRCRALTDAAAVAGLRTVAAPGADSATRSASLNDGTAFLVLFAVTVAVAEALGSALAALVGRFVVSYLGGIMAGCWPACDIATPQNRRTIGGGSPELAGRRSQRSARSISAQRCGWWCCFGPGPHLRWSDGDTRLSQAHAFWDIATFLINGSLWVFVGVQIPGAR